MALNGSGAISLGGTTAGQSIALELGLSGTAAISLNQSDVRSLAGVSSGAITMPEDFWGKSSGYQYWYQVYADATQSIGLMTSGVGVDSSYNVYSAVKLYVGSTTRYALLRKNDALSNIQWSRRATNNFTVMFGSATDSSGNTYCILLQDTSSLSNIFKYNSSGVLQWQQQLSDNSILCQITCSTNGTYVYALSYSPSFDGYTLMRINTTSGAITWQRRLYGDPLIVKNLYAGRISCSPDGLVVAVAFPARTPGSNVNNYMYTARYNSSGTKAWDVRDDILVTDTSATGDTGYGVTVDASGNIYTLRQLYNTGNLVGFSLVTKYNSVGAVTWSRYLTFNSFIDKIFYVFVMSDGSVAAPGGYNSLPWYARLSGSTGLTLNQYTIESPSLIEPGSLNELSSAANAGTSGAVYMGGAVSAPSRRAHTIKTPINTATNITTASTLSNDENVFSVYTLNTLTDVAGSLTVSASALAEQAYTVSIQSTGQIT